MYMWLNFGYIFFSIGSLRLDEPINPPSPARSNHIHGSLQLTGHSKFIKWPIQPFIYNPIENWNENWGAESWTCQHELEFVRQTVMDQSPIPAPYTWLPHATETGVSYEQQLCLSILRLKSFLVLFHCRKESSRQSLYWFGQWRSLVHPRNAWLCVWFPWNLQSDVAITKISCSSVSFICSKILHLRWANPAYSSVRTFTP